MKTARYLLLCLAFLLPGCNAKKKSPGAASEKGQQSTGAAAASGASLPTSAEGLLGLVPADADAALVLLDWEQLFQLVGSLRASFDHHPLGQRLLAQARVLSAASALPLPWSTTELRRLGLDTSKPLLAYGKRNPVALFAVTEVDTFKQSVVALSGGQMKWTRGAKGVETLARPGAAPQLTCAFRPGRTLCSADGEAVTKALGAAPERHRWSKLRPWEQEAATRATALLLADKSSFFLRVEEDGITLRASPALPLPLALSLAGKSESALLGLAHGPRSVLRARIPGPLLARALSPADGLPGLGVDAAALQASLTGELLALEHRAGGLAGILACRDPKVSAQVVEALARAAQQGLKQRRRARGAGDLPAVTIKRASIKDRPGYLIEVASTKKDLPLHFSMALTSGPLGVMIGSPAVLEELLALEQAPARGEAEPGASAEEKEAFDRDALLSLRSPLGDPLGPLAGMLGSFLEREELPAQLKDGVGLMRFLLDQMHGLTLGIVAKDDGLRVVLRLTTLHREGNKEDDAARAIWLKGLTAKYAGDRESLARTIAELAERHPKTRYGALAERDKGGLLVTAVTGALAAVAIPAFLKYIRRAKTVEVHQNLARIVSVAKFLPGESGGNKPAAGKPFPATTPWTPARACCQTGGKCPGEASSWSHPTWRALRFLIEEPHYYQYRFVNQGKRFRVEARGDLDCDGTSSSFSYEGTLESDGSVSLSPLRALQPAE